MEASLSSSAQNMHALKYKQAYSFEYRYNRAQLQLKANNNLVTIICEPAQMSGYKNTVFFKTCYKRSDNIQKVFLKLRQFLKIDNNEQIMLFIGQMNVNMTQTVGQVYDLHKDQDNHLYLSYCELQTFG